MEDKTLAKPVRPDGNTRIIGNTTEPIDGVTTYGNVFASHAYRTRIWPSRVVFLFILKRLD